MIDNYSDTKKLRALNFNEEKLLGSCDCCKNDADAIALTQCLFKKCDKLYHESCLPKVKNLIIVEYVKDGLEKRGIICDGHMGEVKEKKDKVSWVQESLSMMMNNKNNLKVLRVRE